MKKKLGKIGLLRGDIMITYDQIPLVRVSAKRAFERGDIDLEKYSKLISALDKLEEDHRKKEKLSQERMIHTLNRALSFA
jgi:hypothetical protein